MKTNIQDIKAVVFDGDGVIFTGRVFIGPDGKNYKERSLIDGQGISFLRAVDIRVAIVSSEISGHVESLGDKINSLPSVISGKWPKVGIFTGPAGKQKIETVRAWLEEQGLTMADCAYMGDDFTDYKVLQEVGFRACPAQAEEEIKEIADFIADRRGGDGAIRDLANAIIKAKGLKLADLDLK